jgi:hypothetical protein
MVWTTEKLGLHSGQGQEIFFFTTVSRLVLGPTLHPIQWVLQVFSMEVKRPGCETDRSSQFSTKVKKMGGAVTSLPL